MIRMRILDNRMVERQANGESLLPFAVEFSLSNSYQQLTPSEVVLLCWTSPSLLLIMLLSHTDS